VSSTLAVCNLPWMLRSRQLDPPPPPTSLYHPHMPQGLADDIEDAEDMVHLHLNLVQNNLLSHDLIFAIVAAVNAVGVGLKRHGTKAVSACQGRQLRRPTTAGLAAVAGWPGAAPASAKVKICYCGTLCSSKARQPTASPLPPNIFPSTSPSLQVLFAIVSCFTMNLAQGPFQGYTWSFDVVVSLVTVGSYIVFGGTVSSLVYLYVRRLNHS